MTTIKEVAKLAGVAVSTASNAINGNYGVKKETKQKVIEAARKLNYVPNPIAQGLVNRNTGNISIIVSGPSSFNLFNNPVFFEVLRSITQTLNTAGYQAHLNIITTEDEETEIPRIARSRYTDAMILVGSRRNDIDLAQLLGDIDIPVLVVIRSSPSSGVYAVSSDHWNCGYKGTEYLIQLGHKEIAFLGALPGVSIADERLAGYREALEDHGLTYRDSLVIEGDFYQESGLTGIRHMLRQVLRKPTAIFAANDLMALGALEGMEQEGIRVPEDISIMGSDNIPNLHLLKVPLTTISTPFYEIGRLASEKIIGILEGKDDLPEKIVLPSELRVRESTKRMSS
ncbi:LacI family DNA-binding transcriptional regulator [Salibacterium aidingense]|uniref:LacI family DNA-binding transcriptional regulator n=1 Tax=Salibacterium aidingense TaxID=384933 RepID=UPI003BC6FB87